MTPLPIVLMGLGFAGMAMAGVIGLHWCVVMARGWR